MRKPAFCFLVALAGALGGQTPAAVTRGSALRITTYPIVSADVNMPSTRVVGAFDSFRNDTVYIKAPGGAGPAQFYSAQNIQRLERSTGQRHPYAKGAAFGALFGLSVGWGVGKLMRPPFNCYKVSNNTFCNPPDPSEDGYKLAMPVGTVAGALGGLWLSSRMMRHVWIDMPVSELKR